MMFEPYRMHSCLGMCFSFTLYCVYLYIHLLYDRKYLKKKTLYVCMTVSVSMCGYLTV